MYAIKKNERSIKFLLINLSPKDIILPDESTYSSYGYGWVVNKGNQSTISHSGSWVGFRNNVYRNINTGLDVVIFSNRGATLDRWIHDVMKIINETILDY